MFIGDISNGVYKPIDNVWGAPPCEDLSIPPFFGFSSAAGGVEAAHVRLFHCENTWADMAMRAMQKTCQLRCGAQMDRSCVKYIKYIGSPILIIFLGKL